MTSLCQRMHEMEGVHNLQDENGKLKASNDDLTVRLQEVGSQADIETHGPNLKVFIAVPPP